MTKVELIKKLKELQIDAEPENAHFDADNLLLEYINDQDISKEFNNIHKWYS